MINLENEYCLVISDYGRAGYAIDEIDPDHANPKTVLADLISGQYERAVQIVSFGADVLARDISEDMAIDWWNAIKDTAIDYHDIPAFVTAHHPDDLETWLDMVGLEQAMDGPHYAETERLTAADLI